MTAPGGETPAPGELLADAKVQVPLSAIVEAIATKAGFAAAEKVMGDHIHNCQPAVHRRLGALEGGVKSLELSRARLVGYLVGAGFSGGVGAFGIFKLVGG